MAYSPIFRGNTAAVNATSTGDIVANNSANLLKATPVRINSSGELESINVSIEAQALATVGVTLTDINNGSTGPVATSGRVLNIITTANNGDVLYVSKTGDLTNIKPEIGIGGFVAGDFVIRIGTLFKNVSNPSQQDLLLNINIIGQL